MQTLPPWEGPRIGLGYSLESREATVRGFIAPHSAVRLSASAVGGCNDAVADVSLAVLAAWVVASPLVVEGLADAHVANGMNRFNAILLMVCAVDPQSLLGTLFGFARKWSAFAEALSFGARRGV